MILIALGLLWSFIESDESIEELSILFIIDLILIFLEFFIGESF
jgi:hypothetical protein